jgi:hypothetical protein
MRLFRCCPIQIAPAGTPIAYPLEYTLSGGHAKNPILRTKAARTLERLWQAITEVLAAITSQDAQGW